MKKPRKIILVLVAITLAGTACWRFSRPREPQYQGKTLSEWMKDVGRGRVAIETLIPGTTIPRTLILPSSAPLMAFSVSGVKSQKAAEDGRNAINAIGTRALPFLEPTLHADSAIRIRLDPWIQRAAWLKQLFPPSIDKREKAMVALYCLDEEALPFLIQVFKDETTPVDVRSFAAYTFLQYPKQSFEALGALKKARKSSDPILSETSKQAASRIEEMYPHIVWP